MDRRRGIPGKGLSIWRQAAISIFGSCWWMGTTDTKAALREVTGVEAEGDGRGQITMGVRPCRLQMALLGVEVHPEIDDWSL